MYHLLDSYRQLPSESRLSLAKPTYRRKNARMTGTNLPQAFQRAVEHHQSGRLQAAEALYREILSVDPGHAGSLHHLGVLALQVGQHALALDYIGASLRIQPAAEPFSNLGNALLAVGRTAEAETAFRTALSLNPDFGDACNNLGSLLRDLGRTPEAEDYLRTAIRLVPHSAAAHHNLANLLRDSGRLSEAEASYREALRCRPDFPAAHSDLGHTLRRLGRPDEAEGCFRAASGLPAGPARGERLPEAERLVAGAAARQEAGDLEAAATGYRQALALEPDYAEACYRLSVVLTALGRYDEALACCRRTLELSPALPEASYNLGNVLYHLARHDEAAESYWRAVQLRPDYVEAQCNLGLAAYQLGRLDLAEASYRRALALKPTHAETHINLGVLQGLLVQADAADASFRKALDADPGRLAVHSSLLSNAPFTAGHDPAAGLAAARRVGAIFEEADGRRRTSHANLRDPERRLRIGYVSGSLRRHVLTPYVEPVLREHRRDHVAVHVYAHVPRPDAVTARLQLLADGWRFIKDLPDQEAASRIAADGIDILVDLTGHWSDNRLGIFAHKPAPLQVSYLCQNLTTGLPGMDYAIGDRWLNRDGGMQEFASERVIELPSGFQVTAYDQEPPVAPPPSLATGAVTFGCFNNPLKISDRSAALWARVLDRVPGSRLLIKGARSDWPGVQAAILARLTSNGVAASRVDFAPPQPESEYLAFHQNIDMVLDTTPFTGGRTTIDALYMGVPVVTLIGDTAYGRYSFSHLSRIGHGELAVASDDAYVKLAVALALSPERLGTYRSGLREAVKNSSLFHARQHVAELEDAYRMMWRRWCAGEAAGRDFRP